MVDAPQLQRSFRRVAGFGDEFPLFFYSHLFLSHPSTRGMFPATMAAQRDRLVGALVRVVGNVHQVDTVVPFLQQLGRDHRKYGVTADHYPLVGEALLATLEHFLGDEWTPELAADWAAAYGIVSSVMIEAAREAELSTPPWYDAEVIGHESRGPGIAVLTVRPDRRIALQPGQSLSVQTPLVPRVWRYFSPANAPRMDGTLELHVRAVDGGWVSPVLVHSTGKGDMLRIGAAVGHGLTLDENSSADLLMLAGGTGLAPLRAIIEQLGQRHHRRVVYLYVGARSPAELYDMPALSSLQEQHRWLSVVPVVQRGRLQGAEVGEVVDVAVSHRRWHDHEVYVCGSSGMVARSVEVLAAAGVDPGGIRCETYTYGGPQPDEQNAVPEAQRDEGQA